LNRLLNEGLQKSFKISDLNELENENKAKEISEKFENAWREETKHSKERLQIQMARAGLKAFGRDFILSGCCLFLFNQAVGRLGMELIPNLDSILFLNLLFLILFHQKRKDCNM
jgi:hypothetical protein